MLFSLTEYHKIPTFYLFSKYFLGSMLPDASKVWLRPVQCITTELMKMLILISLCYIFPLQLFYGLHAYNLAMQHRALLIVTTSLLNVNSSCMLVHWSHACTCLLVISYQWLKKQVHIFPLGRCQWSQLNISYIIPYAIDRYM